MNDPKAPIDRIKIDGIDDLVELALNPHWSWNHAADKLWEGLDKELWVSTQNPWVILRTVSKEKIKAVLGAPEFRMRLYSLLRQNRESYDADAWFQNKHRDAEFTSIAYFSMEFMLSEALPIYSGGLGSDRVTVGVGILVCPRYSAAGLRALEGLGCQRIRSAAGLVSPRTLQPSRAPWRILGGDGEEMTGSKHNHKGNSVEGGETGPGHYVSTCIVTGASGRAQSSRLRALYTF